MNLNNFENYIDKTILARGTDYYENDYVVSVEEIDDNVYEAEVEGTELYTVEVELDNEAAIKSPVSKKRKTSDIRKILFERTKEDLVEFLMDIASEYKEIKQRIELNFDNENDEDEIAKAIMLIRTFISNNSDRYGFVAYGGTNDAVKGADLVLGKARFAFKQNKTIHAVDLALCVTHEMMDLLEEADDSDGVIGGVIEESFDLISEMVDEREFGSVDKESIFDKLIEESTNGRYEGWTDWRLNLLEMCSRLTETLNLRNKLEQHLLSIVKGKAGDSWSADYLAESINMIRYHMVEEYDGEKKAQEFIKQNLQYSNFRKMAIESAMDKNDYDYVIKLTIDGEEKDKGAPGLINQWKEYRYKAFQLSGKTEEQRGVAMDFILDGSYEYYKELKNTYDKNAWLSVYPEIIFLLENQKKTYQDVYTSILIEEGEKQKLLEYVKGRPSSVEIFYKHLIHGYKEEVYALFLQYIEQTAARASNRKDYQGVCAIIRNLKKAGGKEQALEVKQKLFNKYANRPAFRDELSRV